MIQCMLPAPSGRPVCGEGIYSANAVKLKGQEIMNVPATQAGDGQASSIVGQRFAYPGGSRPLDGYTIKRGIGHGGFGEVYFATSDAGKEVALKLIRRSLDVELRGIKQCINLKHPNLLAVFDIKEDAAGDHWVVMEYVSGECLDDVIADNPDGMPVEKALSWFFGMAAGVAYLHDHGIVHRDLKPGNIFSDEGRVEIGDYGLSKFISCSRRSGHTESVGTVHYMAPEVANGRYGKEIDVYALGVILFEMLTGSVPFEGESVGEVLMKHLTAKPDVSGLAEPYRSIIARALEKDPAKRFSTVHEMAAHLPHPKSLPVNSFGHSATAGPGLSQLGADAARGVFPDAPQPLCGGTGGENTAPVAEAVEEEPVQQAVLQQFAKIRNFWIGLNAPAKIAIGIFVVFAFLTSSEIIMPIAVVGLIAYGGYRIVWALMNPRQSSQSTQEPAGNNNNNQNGGNGKPQHGHLADRVEHAERRAQRAGHHVRRRLTRIVSPREKALEALVVKPVRRRIADLLGSMLMATLVAMTMCLVMVIVSGFRSEIPRPEQCAWLLLVGIAGSWAVMIPSKFWEGTRGEAMLRRFVLLIAGLVLGAWAWGVSKLLLVEFPHDTNFPAAHDFQMPGSFYNGGPQLLAFLAVFGTLLALVRWWRQSDPLRSTRISLWSLFITATLAGVIAWAWHFPQPWLIMAACTISASVQMSSPWLNPRKQRAANEPDGSA